MRISLQEFWGAAGVVGALMVADAAVLALVGPSRFFLHNPFFLAVCTWALINLALFPTFLKAGVPLHSTFASLLFAVIGLPLSMTSGLFLIGDITYATIDPFYLAFMAFAGATTVYLNHRLRKAHSDVTIMVEIDHWTARVTGIDAADWFLRCFFAIPLSMFFVPFSMIRDLSRDEVSVFEILLMTRYQLVGMFVPLGLVALGAMLRNGRLCLLGGVLRLGLIGISMVQLQRLLPARNLESLMGDALILDVIAMIGMTTASVAMIRNSSHKLSNPPVESIPGAVHPTEQKPPATPFGLSRLEYGIVCLLGVVLLLTAYRYEEPWKAAESAIKKKNLKQLTAILDRHPELLSWVHPFFKTNLVHSAARDGSSEILRYLADRGIDTNLRSESGFPPTYWMMEPQRLADLRYLAERGTDFTPDFFIHCAITGIHRQTDFAVLDFLFEQRKRKGVTIEHFGKKPDSVHSEYSRADEMMNPVAAAARKGNPKLCEYLRGKGFPVDNDVARGAIQSNEPEALLPFLRTHARIIDDTGTARPLAFDACRLRRPEWFAEFVGLGMNPLAIDADGNNPWHDIARYTMHDEDIGATLASYGADINAVNKAGKTPLWLSIEYRQPANLGVFLRMGADPNIPGPGGKRPIDFARAGNNPNLIRILERATGAPTGDEASPR